MDLCYKRGYQLNNGVLYRAHIIRQLWFLHMNRICNYSILKPLHSLQLSWDILCRALQNMGTRMMWDLSGNRTCENPYIALIIRFSRARWEGCAWFFGKFPLFGYAYVKIIAVLLYTYIWRPRWNGAPHIHRYYRDVFLVTTELGWEDSSC